MDEVLNVKVSRTAKRALKIYCATENKTERDVVTAALNSKVPPGYIRQAVKALKLEDGPGSKVEGE